MYEGQTTNCTASIDTVLEAPDSILNCMDEDIV